MIGPNLVPLFLFRMLNTASRPAIESFEISHPELPNIDFSNFQDDRKALHYFNWTVRAGATPPRLIYDSLHRLKPKGPEGMTDRDRFEWCLFLFAEKDWPALAACLEGLSLRGLPQKKRQKVLFDLAWLCKYRLLLKGKTQHAALIAKWLYENQTKIPRAQLALLQAFDRFRAMHPNGDQHEIVEAAKKYTPHFALAAVRTLYSMDVPFGKAPTIPHNWIRSSEQLVVVSIAMDVKYFEKYFRRFEAQLLKVAPEIGLHLCAVDFIPEPDALSTKIGLSSMSLPQHLRSSQSSRAAFFASARYLNLHDCLEHYQQVHVTDVDGLVTPEILRPLTSAVTLHSKIQNAPIARLPFDRVSAAGVSVRRSTDAFRFAGYLRSYLQYGFEHSQNGHWYIDQNALFSGWREFKDSFTFETDRPIFFRQASNWQLAGGVQAKIDFQTQNYGSP
jgi:hypothetical protein